MIRSLGNRIFQPWCCGPRVDLAAHAWSILEVVVRVERYGSRATVSFESLHIRIPLKFCQNSAKLSQFFRNSENFRTSQRFLECSAKFRKKIINIGAKLDENCRKIRIFAEIRAKIRQTFSYSCSNFCKNPYFSTIFIDLCTDFDDFFSEFRRTF